ncbi:hypothetical protein N7456_000333 [Penicillium angulare]|uniref:Suppressor of anucleate metulae protein B n=1 Tax=Penicillium angulare TaxID=116970 RepID=A0A9W9KS11_9EURO|nr:hypothetical protein N7456_000333 [Penicillium angulare]
MSTEAPICAEPSCKKAATTSCDYCEPPTQYCSDLCLKADYKRHKKGCNGAEKSNCFLIRAKASNGGTSDTDHIERFSLESYGEWKAEMKELKERLSWAEANEGGKFYSHDKSVHRWYYYLYNFADKNKTQNEIASRCTGRTIYGDVAVVRSSPVGFNDYAKRFSRGELLRTLDFYRHNNPCSEFAERERTRCSIDIGLGPDGLRLSGATHISMSATHFSMSH